MTNKITVVVDIDDTESLTEHGSLDGGVYGMDRDGVYHMWYGSRSYLVRFSPPCEYCGELICNCEEVIDKNIQAQERTEQ